MQHDTSVEVTINIACFCQLWANHGIQSVLRVDHEYSNKSKYRTATGPKTLNTCLPTC